MPLLKKFVKYQSLGNDFVIFDWLKKPAIFIQAELIGSDFKASVQRLCDRHYGVGADGVLVLTTDPHRGLPHMTVYNADGSKAESCLNGLRCIADYLFAEHRFAPQFEVMLGARIITCSVQQESSGKRIIVTQVGTATILGEQCVTTGAGTFSGMAVSVGNPHFFIEQYVALPWLAEHGAAIESHAAFPEKTNVEFVWQEPALHDHTISKAYGMHIYERGCGITLACSSGAAAFTGLLRSAGKIKEHELISISMPGGVVMAWVDEEGVISLQATAQEVFSGLLSL
jgi:diaminopimelate epimerase